MIILTTEIAFEFYSIIIVILGLDVFFHRGEHEPLFLTLSKLKDQIKAAMKCGNDCYQLT